MIPNSLVQLDGLVDILSDGSVIGRVLVKDLLPAIEMMMMAMVMMVMRWRRRMRIRKGV